MKPRMRNGEHGALRCRSEAEVRGEHGNVEGVGADQAGSENSGYILVN